MSRSDEIRNNISNEYEKTPGYLIWDIAEAAGQVMDRQDEEIGVVAGKLKLENLSGDELDLFVKERKGITRRPATHAVGELTVKGSGTVNRGDLFETANGVQFEAAEKVSVSAEATVPIQAVVAGNGGIVGSGSIVQIPITIQGINSCINEEATTDGFDEETDESIRERYLIALQTPVSSGNKASYRNWALEVSGVGDAKVFPLTKGNWTVEVVIIDSDKQPASELLVQEVQKHIDPDSTGKGEGEAPIGAQCYVSAATALNINISVAITTSAVHETVEKNIKDKIAEYLKTIAFKGKSVSYAQIGNAILDVAEVQDYENLLVNGGTGNIAVGERDVAITGTVEVTYGE